MNVEIAGAIARGYCSEKNSHKVLDPDLVEAMAVEVEKLLRQPGKSIIYSCSKNKIKIKYNLNRLPEITEE